MLGLYTFAFSQGDPDVTHVTRLLCLLIAGSLGGGAAARLPSPRAAPRAD